MTPGEGPAGSTKCGPLSEGSLRTVGTGIARWIQGIPISFKILGIGGVVTILSCSLCLLHVCGALIPALHDRLELETRSTGFMLQDTLRAHLIRGDRAALTDHIRHALLVVPNLRYVIVQDGSGRIMAHSFDRAVPVDLLARQPPAGEGEVQILQSPEGGIYDAQFPVLAGSIGRVRIGLTDRSIRATVEGLIKSVLFDLGLVAALSVTLTLLLGQFLVAPLHELVQAAHRIGKGEFEVRARVHATDEIGTLTEAFNGMAASLESFRASVQAKERERLELVDRTVQSLEDERKSMALELHDHIGQQLLVLLMTVRDAGETAQVSTSVRDDVVVKVEELIAEVRRFAWGLRPAILDECGLEAALSQYTREIAARGSLEIDSESVCPVGLPRLPARIELTLYRVAQEAITNVIRHANARHASVVLVRDRGWVTLVIDDDGCGFDPEAVRNDGRHPIGLIGMRERVDLVGGHLSVDAGLRRGVTIRAKIAVPEEESA